MKLTQSERRRIYLAQQAARQAMLDHTHEPVPGTPVVGASRRRWLKTVIVVTLIGGGLLACSVVQFHPPTSLEAFLPQP